MSRALLRGTLNSRGHASKATDPPPVGIAQQGVLAGHQRHLRVNALPTTSCVRGAAAGGRGHEAACPAAAEAVVAGEAAVAEEPLSNRLHIRDPTRQSSGPA